MSKKAYIRRLIVRVIEDSLILTGLFVGMGLVGCGVSLAFRFLGVL
jgi:hypothetical protein